MVQGRGTAHLARCTTSVAYPGGILADKLFTLSQGDEGGCDSPAGITWEVAALRGLRAVAAAIGVHPGERYRGELLQGARI